MQAEDYDESLTSVSGFTPEMTPKHMYRKVTLLGADDKAMPLVEKAFRNIELPVENHEMKQAWNRRRSSIGPGFGQKSAPQLLDFMEGARRRASRVTLADETEFCASVPASPKAHPTHSPGGSNTPCTTRSNSPTPNQERLTTLRNELERCRFDILQMADVGSALLVELEDTKTVMLEVECEKDRHEKSAEMLTEASNAQKKQINELKVTISKLKEEMGDMRRVHELELREVEDKGGGLEIQEEEEQMYQGVALQQLRRAKLVAERVEAAQALFRVGSAEPQIVEVMHRRHIEEQMWQDRCDLMWDCIEASQGNWKQTQNIVDQLESSNASLRGQMHKTIEARLRAESIANQQAELHEDARKVVTQKTQTIQRLQADLSARRVANQVAEDLGPAVQSALRRVHDLKQRCFGDFAASPLRPSPPRDPMTPAT